MKINPSVLASAIRRYEKAVRKEKAEPAPHTPADRIHFSENARIYNNLIKSTLSEEDVNIQMLSGVMNRMAAESRSADVDTIIEKILDAT